MDILAYAKIKKVLALLNGKDITFSDGNIYTSTAKYTPVDYHAGAVVSPVTAVSIAKDLIIYARLKFAGASDYLSIKFSNSSSVEKALLSIGYNYNDGAKDSRTISIKDVTNNANTVIGTVDFQSSYRDLVVWYDNKWGYINIYVDNVLIGYWKPAVGGSDLSTIASYTVTFGSTATMVSVDYLYSAFPLVTAIGDSITAGATLHSPNPDHYAGVDNYASSYPRYISDYLKSGGVRNYFVVNKGVNGEDSVALKARFYTDIVLKGCKYAFIHGGINDHATVNDVTITVANKRAMADSALSAGIKPIILGVTPTKSAFVSPYNYSKILNTQEKTAYTGYDYISLWYSIQDPALQDTALNSKMSDDVHPNITGYQSMANTITDKILLI
jgi:lysophospholipase L1-like esterase